jgi:SAM-dependent methyltransferase
MRILDVGGGAHPTVPAQLRPQQCHYVGLDIAEEQLLLGGSEAYDAIIVSDIVDVQDAYRDSFDLIVSRFTLEHMADLPAAFVAMRAYLRDGGKLLALFSGRYATFAIANRLLPEAASKWLLNRLLSREHDSVFKAYYNHCTYGDLNNLLDNWSSAVVTPIFTGQDYFAFSKTLAKLYLKYEDWTVRKGYNGLASYYMVEATK